MAIKTELEEALKKIERLEAAAKRDREDLRRCSERIDTLSKELATAMDNRDRANKELKQTKIVLQQTVTALASAAGVPGALSSSSERTMAGYASLLGRPLHG